jgi:hypothetical protein
MCSEKVFKKERYLNLCSDINKLYEIPNPTFKKKYLKVGNDLNIEVKLWAQQS